ncbi:mevalonate kinase [Lewinella sp. JB7]|uniref:mevalonate kinase family protein n=1 Tax=Lewinella sp. JB7 TaxID=2962887 RepID=UPI0020C94448|nr:hypothetical protein [Lewinella sp. JB7]MCP9234622.1 hypothetical protein [Lewinella sp. JB7]
MSRPYPAKILLFGEHTVLRGGRGLAVPYPDRALRWIEGSPDERLCAFARYLRQPDFAAYLATDRLMEEVFAGRRLTGNIPTGYGLGSSGAVCAAVFDAFARPEAKQLPLRELRAFLAAMEGHFHGQSSGTDPLIAYLRRPLLLSAGGAAGAVELPESWAHGFFLLDTGRSRSASGYIERFLRAYDDTEGASIEQGWSLPADRAISALIADEPDALYAAFAAISSFQLTRFPDFIPEDFRTTWDGGGEYRLKLCGAGGGGMLLGLARNRQAVESVYGKRLSWL